MKHLSFVHKSITAVLVESRIQKLKDIIYVNTLLLGPSQ